jgi:hypothetical protein
MTSTNDIGASNGNHLERDLEDDHGHLRMQGLQVRQRLHLRELRLQARVNRERRAGGLT